MSLAGGFSWNVHLVWDPQIRGMLFTGIAVVMLIGSVFLLLATNTGFRMGLWITLTGLFAWMTLLTAVWTIYALKQGPPDPTSHESHWVVKEVITGDVPSQTGYEPTSDFAENGVETKNGWLPLPKEDANYGDAVAATDNALAPPAPSPESHEAVEEPTYKGISPYSSTSDYIVTNTFYKGGESYWPMNVGVRSAKAPRSEGLKEYNCASLGSGTTSAVKELCSNENLVSQCSDGSGKTCVTVKLCSAETGQSWLERSTKCQLTHAWDRISKGFLHKPHYAVVQVQRVVNVDLTKLPLGAVPPAPVADSVEPVTSVIMVRKLGTPRVMPAIWFLGSLTIFVVLGYGLHRRDKAIWQTNATGAAQAATT